MTTTIDKLRSLHEYVQENQVGFEVFAEADAEDPEKDVDMFLQYYNLMSSLLPAFLVAVAALKEVVADIKAVGEEEVENDWPDLIVSYMCAKEALRRLQ